VKHENAETMKKSIYIIAYILLALSYPLSAQYPGRISGSVAEAGSQNIVPFANIELLKSGDSALVRAVVTGDDGKYVLENIAAGKYMLRISCLGYKKEIVPEFEITPRKPQVQFGATLLIAEATALDEVTVYGHKLTGQLEDGKTVYTIRSKSAETAQSGLELLRQLPDVTVGLLSEEVKLAGSNNVLFQVNGRKVDQSYLQQLNPLLVDKVEVINVPGAKYDSNIDAVINIVLKRNIALGVSGRIRAQFPLSSTLLSKDNGNIDLYYKKFRVYLSGNYKYSKYEIENVNEREQRISNETVGRLSQNALHTNKSMGAGFNYGLDYFPNEKNAFSFFSAVQPVTPNRNRIFTSNNYMHEQTQLNTLTSNFTREENAYSDYSLYYKHTFAKNHEISVENFLSNRRNIRNNEFFDQEYQPGNLLGSEKIGWTDQETKDRNRQIMLCLDYTLPLSSSVRLSSGYNGFLIRSKSDYNERIAATADQIRYDENRQVLYSNLMWNKGTLNVQAGARFEYSDIDITHAYDTSNVYSYLFPSASIGYKWKDKHTFGLNYRMSVMRPSISQLSPVNYTNDPYSQSVGNPRLRPGIVNRIELTHRIQLSKSVYLSYTPYFSLIRHDIRQVIQPGSDSVTTYKYANVGKAQEFGITLSGNADVNKWWTVSSSFTYFNREVDALPAYGIANASGRSSWRMNLSSQVVLPKEWVFLVEYNYNGPFIDAQTTTHSYYECVLGLNKTIKKRFNIFIFTLNPWSSSYTYDHKTMTTGEVTQRSRETLKYNYLLIVRLGYSFKTGKEGRRLDRDHATDEVQPPKKGVL
jgi:outer membrane receptor protein involved in Fe transport